MFLNFEIVSPLRSKLQSGIAESQSPSGFNFERKQLLEIEGQKNMAERSTKKKTSSITDWTQLPKELIQIIIEKFDNCFDVVHVRSVCSLWRSTFPLPSCLLSPSYSLPTYPIEKEGLCSLEKIPVVLFRVPTAVESVSEYFVEGIFRDESGDYMEFSSPLQCTLRVKLASSDSTVELAGCDSTLKISGSDSTLKNMLDCQIFSLGNQYRIIRWSPKGVRTIYKYVAFLPLNEGGGGGGFVVLRRYYRTLLMFRSVERRWFRVMDTPNYTCTGLVAFRGRFYTSFWNREVFVIDPYLLISTRLMPEEHLNGSKDLIASDNDELFLVERITLTHAGGSTLRVSRLDEEAGKWVETTDLGDRVLFVGYGANVSCSAKQLPDGCGVTGNSILFNDRSEDVTFFYKYGLSEGVAGGSDWRISRESSVKFLKSPTWAFRVEC
ncbi:F-box/kelch-repeat protein At1g64840 isoform X2 [Eutrema salsugineum]|uniref:F-box/kelch-repeat protein At1g64840 isoform X2 n=1 Tax=Eutrema salsugineum TaxID=72664 RepID=UPI000CECF547|nr:F-box/kelch-repeat protein At1g64840 isoform X2 [Eutrema salsugineum]